MALQPFIPPCVQHPPHPLHSPHPKLPLRIQIQGPLESIQKLLPSEPWYPIEAFPQSGGLRLAELTHDLLYGRHDADIVPIVRDEYLAWAVEERKALDYIDYYGVTFDHLVPHDDPNPQVLALSVIEVDYDDGAFANTNLRFKVDPEEYTGKKVLVVPRCCQVKKGSQDRKRWNDLVAERDAEIHKWQYMRERHVNDSLQ